MAGIIFSPLHRSPSIRGRDKANAGNYAVNQNDIERVTCIQVRVILRSEIHKLKGYYNICVCVCVR